MMDSQTSKSTVSNLKKDSFLFQFHPQIGEFKYVGILLMSDMMEQEINKWILSWSAVMWPLPSSVVVNNQLSQNMKILISPPVYFHLWSSDMYHDWNKKILNKCSWSDVPTQETFLENVSVQVVQLTDQKVSYF